MARTLYDVLMISPAADRQLITVVYRHLAKRYHPDVDPSREAEARMAELNEAYDILSDRDKRARYDEQLGVEVGRPTLGPGNDAADDASGGPRHTSAASPYGEAGPPPVNPEPKGPILTFGRYRGWALNQVGRFDRDYLEWLARTTMGRNYRRELDELLRRT
jgi:curved DNA-binding protein CbpA